MSTEQTLHPSADSQARNAPIADLIRILEGQKARKRDIVVPATHISMEQSQVCIDDMPEQSFLGDLLRGTGVQQAEAAGETQPDRLAFSVLNAAHGDICDRLGIPKKFYDRLLGGHPDLLDHVVTTLFGRGGGNHFVRTFMDEDTTGVVRAILSDRYKVIDHFDVLYTSLKAIKATGVTCKVESCDLSDRRMRVRFYRPDAEIEARELLARYRSPRPGMDGGMNGGLMDMNIFTGFQITNSETGNGRFSITPRFIVKACRNGYIMRADAIEQTHLGGQMQTGVIEWSEETRNREMELILAQVRDAVTGFLDPSFLKAKIDYLTHANQPLTRPADATDNVVKFLQLTECEREALLTYFMGGADTTAWGLAQAVTALAYDTESADRAEELEMGALEAFEIALATTR